MAQAIIQGKSGQILFYDADGMRVFDCSLFDVWQENPEQIDCTSLDSYITHVIIGKSTRATARIELGEVKAELDPTTMKRIAKYNLDKDFEELNQKINEAEEKLSQLDKEINTRKEKLLFMERLFEEIWNDKKFDEEKYLPDGEEDDWE